MTGEASLPVARLALAPRYSYRDDPAVPRFDDSRPLVVFDGVCILCSRSMRSIARADAAGEIQFTAAQAPLGRALFVHYGLDPDAFETFLYIEDGHALGKLDAALAIARRLGSWWRVALVFGILPAGMRDWLYDRVAKNRYRLFGRTEACFIPDASWRERVIE
jgi:predicted DCC family thiol-disulfide oxidoreductase YuxK